MNFLKNIFIVFVIVAIGIITGIYIYNSSNYDTKKVFNENKKIYLMQYGVYKDKGNMENSTKDLLNYFFYKDKDGYHVIIGIVFNKNNSKKIEDIYDLKDNIYLKEVNISNMEFIETLKQYENLIINSNDNNFIINAEKQVLSKYEELVLNSE